MGLTVKGAPMDSSQQSTANALLAEGAKLQAGAIASQAIILAAIYENSISLGTYGGRIGPLSPLIGAKDSTGVPYAIGQSGIVQQAHDFFAGGGAFSSAIAKARTTSDIVIVAEFAEGAEGQYETEAFPLSSGIAEAKAIVSAYGGSATAGGVAGLGGTGTAADGSPSSTYPFVIGTTANPDEDMWTGTNRLAQEVNWYLFSNGENMFFMEGQELLAQNPALYLDRIGDSDRILHITGVYDNTAYQYVSDHKRKFHVQRKTKLTTITSPTEITLDLVCGIDEIRGGDLIELSSFGAMDGKWLIGDRTRSVFAVSSSLTLVPPIAPLSEVAAAGTTGTSKNAVIMTPGSSGNNATGRGAGTYAGLVSPFTKKYQATLGVNTDQGVDFGTQQGIQVGDPILAIGDCTLATIVDFSDGGYQPGMFFQFSGGKLGGYWGWYVAEQLNPRVQVGPGVLKAGTVVATYASSGTGIEIGWAAGPGQTAAAAFSPGSVATRHDGSGTPEGNNFYAFLQTVGAI